MQVKDEATLMAYSEEIIYEIQDILKGKPDLLHYCVLKKAMEIEEFLYVDALAKTRLDRNSGHVWQSRDSIREYQISAEKLIKRIKERGGDWVKLYNITEIKNFMYQVYQDPGPSRKVERRVQPPSKSVKFAKKVMGKKVKGGANMKLQPQQQQTVVATPSRPLEMPSVSLSDLPPRVAAATPLGSGGVTNTGHDHEFDYTQDSAISAVGVGHMSEDASDLLNSMFDDDFDVLGGDAEEAMQTIDGAKSSGHLFSSLGNKTNGEASNGSMFITHSQSQLKSSISMALLGGDDDDISESSGMQVWDDSLLSAASAQPGAMSRSQQQVPVPQPSATQSVAPSTGSIAKSAEEERVERLNAQRELERRQRQELKPVVEIDKARKYLFDDDDI